MCPHSRCLSREGVVVHNGEARDAQVAALSTGPAMHHDRSRSPVPPWHPTNFGVTQEELERALKGSSKGKGKGFKGKEDGDIQSDKGSRNGKGYGKWKGKGIGKDKGLGGPSPLVWPLSSGDEEDESSNNEEEQQRGEARADAYNRELIECSVREIVIAVLREYELIPS